MRDRTTPEIITSLLPNQVFVFGSNEAGIHGAGAAKAAVKFGSVHGKGFGMHGNTFAIPTKNRSIETLSLWEIAKYVELFHNFAMNSEHLDFLVTPIGCGLAGYTPKQIAPIFVDFISLYNVWLPDSFWKILTPRPW